MRLCSAKKYLFVIPDLGSLFVFFSCTTVVRAPGMRNTKQHTSGFRISEYKWEQYIAGKCLGSMQRFSGDLVCCSHLLS